jgi:hypothetical protein
MPLPPLVADLTGTHVNSKFDDTCGERERKKERKKERTNEIKKYRKKNESSFIHLFMLFHERSNTTKN